MNILSVAYPLMPVSHDSAGGAEQILWHLEQGIVAAGHKSVVIAAAGSKVCGRLIETPRAEGDMTDEIRRDAQKVHRNAMESILRHEAIDVVHFHGLDFAEYLPLHGPTMLATMHLPLQWYPQHVFQIPGLTLNLVSRSQGNGHPHGGGLPVVGNGVDLTSYKPAARRDEFLLILARICPEKGIDVALRVARRLDARLLLAGPVHSFASHQAYFAECVEPLLDRRRQYLGPVDLITKADLLARTKCLLAPSSVAETSSLVAMEAAASGAPVIAWRSGALPEIVEHGITGLIVDSEDQMAEAIGHIAEVSSESCRSTAEARFDVHRMIEDYLTLYHRL